MGRTVSQNLSKFGNMIRSSTSSMMATASHAAMSEAAEGSSSASSNSSRGGAAPSKKQMNQASMLMVSNLKEQRARGDLEDLVKQPYRGDYMINPRSRKRITWDIGITAPLLIYLTVMMPFRLCFANEPELRTSE